MCKREVFKYRINRENRLDGGSDVIYYLQGPEESGQTSHDG